MADRSQFEADLRALSALTDDRIDTSDIAERADFSNPSLGRYFHLSRRHYDVRAIANWCLQKAFAERLDTTSMWLNKIVYFIHEFGLKEYNTLFTDAKVEAWAHGPVFREIYFGDKSEKIQSFFKKFDKVTRKKQEAWEDFSELDIKIFNDVWKKFGHMSASKLRNISHQEGGAWYLVWHYRGSSNPGMEIDIATILGQKVGQPHGRND